MMPGMKAADITPTPPATALTYDQSAQLMTDLTFKGRIKTACLKFAEYVLNEPTNAPAHNVRFRWAQNCFMSPDSVAGQVQPPTVMQASVQSDGSDISDPDLQVAVETTINEIL